MCAFDQTIIQLIGQHTQSLREVKLSLQRSLQKSMNMAEKEGKDWWKSSLLNIISLLKSSLYDVNSCIKKVSIIWENLYFNRCYSVQSSFRSVLICTLLLYPSRKKWWIISKSRALKCTKIITDDTQDTTKLSNNKENSLHQWPARLWWKHRPTIP